MDARKPGPGDVQRQGFPVGADRPLVVGVGGRRQGRRHSRRSVQGMLPGRFQISLHGSVQEIVPPAAMDMQVDESRGDKLASGIDPFSRRRVGLGDDGLDPAVPDH